MRETKENLFICSTNQGDLKMISFDENFNYINKYEEKVDGSQEAFSIIYSYYFKNYYAIFQNKNNGNSTVKFSSNETIEYKEGIIKNITNYIANLSNNSPYIISTIPKILSSTFLESTILSTILITSSSPFSTLLTKQSNIPTILSSSSLSLFVSNALKLSSTLISENSNKNIFYSSILSSSTTLFTEEISEETENIIITKENLKDKIQLLLKDKEIGQIYKIKGEGYLILIYPTNSTNLTFNTHVNFFECETLLRNHYHIQNSTVMTFLQIELENDNSNSLINQVEYQALDGNKTILDLSICENANIQVFYSIKNNTIADFESAKYFKQRSIDIFNINDSFFNDICEPYSEFDDDLILEDRIKYKYQNYSLCEIGCTYDKMDFDNMIILCNCKVKNNISTTISPINFQQVEGSSTNFEVIKCYSLVFSLDGKLDNIGFWIFRHFSFGSYSSFNLLFY